MIEISIFFDIETLPTERPDLIAAIAEGVRPPAAMKKADTILRWEIEEKPTAVADAIAKTSFDGGTGRIAAIGWAIGDTEEVAGASVDEHGTHTEAAERMLLQGFFAECDAVRREHGVPPILIGHNVTGFDIRWLWKRAIVLGIRPPYWWPVDAKPWDAERVVDTMELWEGRGGRIGLDRLARILGLGGKGGIDGSMVAGMWREGRYEEVREYCADDVALVRDVWRRITGHVPAQVAINEIAA